MTDERTPIQRVVLADIDVSFFDLVLLLVTLAIAAIPAAIIVAIVYMALGFIFAGVVGSLGV